LVVTNTEITSLNEVKDTDWNLYLEFPIDKCVSDLIEHPKLAI